MSQTPRRNGPVADPAPGRLVDPPSLVSAIEPLLTVTDLARLLVCDRRTVERLRAAGRLPRPDLMIGRLPRWKPETIRRWIENGGRA
jgi:excisionase family DNA binding protein